MLQCPGQDGCGSPLMANPKLSTHTCSEQKTIGTPQIYWDNESYTKVWVSHFIAFSCRMNFVVHSSKIDKSISHSGQFPTFMPSMTLNFDRNTTKDFTRLKKHAYIWGGHIHVVLPVYIDRLAQPYERNAFNLVIVGSSPTVGEMHTLLSH